MVKFEDNATIYTIILLWFITVQSWWENIITVDFIFLMHSWNLMSALWSNEAVASSRTKMLDNLRKVWALQTSCRCPWDVGAWVSKAKRQISKLFAFWRLNLAAYYGSKLNVKMLAPIRLCQIQVTRHCRARGISAHSYCLLYGSKLNCKMLAKSVGSWSTTTSLWRRSGKLMPFVSMPSMQIRPFQLQDPLEV